MTESKLVLFDGNALIHRAYHALPPLTIKKTGEMVNAAYGFVAMLLKVINEIKPSCYAIAFDRKAPTFRHRLFDRYKAQRPAMPEELAGQLGRVRQIVEAFNMPVFEMDGFEADDMLGTLSRQASEQGIETIIVTGDADAMQLVSPAVKVLYPKPRKSFSDTMLYDEAAVLEKYGVKPEQIADLKALQGDSSDNIPGVPGIGEKTAVTLLQKFASVEDIYNRIDEVTPPKLKEKLVTNEAIARQSKELTTIVTNAPVTLDLNSCRVSNFDRNKVSELFREMEFYSLVSKLPGTAAAEAPQSQMQMHLDAESVPGTCKIINTSEGLAELAESLKSAKTFSFDTETTGLNPLASKLVGISVSTAAGQAAYIPVGHELTLGQSPQLAGEEVIKVLKPIFESPDIAKAAHNGKFDMAVLAEFGIDVNNLAFDTMVAAYLLGEKSLSLKGLAFEKFGIEMTPITDIIGTGRQQITMSQADIGKVADYCGADADTTGRLVSLFRPELEKQELWQLFAEVEMPLVPVLRTMERDGVLLDTVLLHELSRRLGNDLLKLEADIYNAVGHQFNINSSQQLSGILFEELNLPKARKTASGYSTDAAVLEELRDHHPVIRLILDYRQLTKLKSTYIDALPELVSSKTGRVHTSFNQTRTTTGRLSSSDPNLQNIPIRSDLGKQVRRAFIAPPGAVLLAGDYSQIDLRSLAHLSQDKALMEAFRNNEDIHSATAAKLYDVTPDKVTPDMRRLAKTVNFGVIYGMSEYGLEQATELSRGEAGKFIKAYFERYPQVTEYLENTKQQARTGGYVQTLLGRRRYIPEINASNRIIREAAERMAINMPVQGTSADIIKVAMVKLAKEMGQRKVRSRMILQVHDELIFEVPEEELTTMQELVRSTMADAVKLSIPVKVDMKQGQNWGEME